MTTKQRYAQVGIGGRAFLFMEAILEQFADTCELVALCDLNEGRLRLGAEWARGRGAEVETYRADAFDAMVAQARPDVVIVTSQDSTHDEYICRAMKLGCNVVTEKPMTTDEHKCRRILDTQKQTGRRCKVTFNYRYAPPRTQVKDLLMSGVIGNVLWRTSTSPSFLAAAITLSGRGREIYSFFDITFLTHAGAKRRVVIRRQQRHPVFSVMHAQYQNLGFHRTDLARRKVHDRDDHPADQFLGRIEVRDLGRGFLLSDLGPEIDPEFDRGLACLGKGFGADHPSGADIDLQEVVERDLIGHVISPVGGFGQPRP